MVELTNPIKYHLCQQSPLPPVSWLYDYVIAANGVFKRAENHYMAVCIPITEGRWCRTGHKSATLAGLCPCKIPDFALKIAKVPAQSLADIIDDARTHHKDCGKFVENYYVINDKYRALRPTQKGTANNVEYKFGPLAMSVSHTFLIDIHTHPQNAFFSATDNADEKGFKIYGVLGHLSHPKPELVLRLGVYGDFMTLRADEVFGEGVNELVEWEAWI